MANLIRIGWWCWASASLVRRACDDDDVPMYVPEEHADDMIEAVNDDD